MLTDEEKKIIAAVKANWDDRSVPGQLVKIIERLTAPSSEPRPARSERAIPRGCYQEKPFPSGTQGW